MGHSCCQVVLVVEQDEVEHLDGDALSDKLFGVPVRHQVVHQVAAGGATGEDSDRTLVGRGVVAGILEGMPGGLQEQALLGIHHPGGVGGHPKVLGVELVDPIEHGRTPDVCGIGERRGADSGGGQHLLRKSRNGFLARTQVVPEFRH